MQQSAISVVILTMGDRPEALSAAIASVRRAPVPLQVVVVWNGVDVDPTADSDVDVVSAQNVGIPAGRNLGASACDSDIVFFLDDDARLVEPGQLTRSLDRFESTDVAVVGARLVDEFGETARRHVPRIGGRSAERSGPVALFLGGASLHRRSAFEAVGGYAAAFRYAMEETDLAVRLVGAGYTLWYDATMIVYHPASSPARHPANLEQTARNRVWHAHRNLPAPVAVVYVATWLTISLARNARSRRGVASVVTGTWHGVRSPVGPRRPISYRAVLRLTRLGRPPIV